MPIISLEQGSAAWLKYRQSRVMATDISVILSSNPWKTKLELWEEKLEVRPPKPINEAMRRGIMLEETARMLASIELKTAFNPIVYQSNKYPWLAASLDGINNTLDAIIEIKCPKEFTHLDACNGYIPEYYNDQIQTQLVVTGADICYYFSYRPEYADQPFAVVEIFPDFGKQDEIIAKGSDFYFNHLCVMNPSEEWKLKERK